MGNWRTSKLFDLNIGGRSFTAAGLNHMNHSAQDGQMNDDMRTSGSISERGKEGCGLWWKEERGERAFKRSNGWMLELWKGACPAHLRRRVQREGGGPVTPTSSHCRPQSTTSTAWKHIRHFALVKCFTKDVLENVSDAFHTRPSAAWCARHWSHGRSSCTPPRSSLAHYKHTDHCLQLPL